MLIKSNQLLTGTQPKLWLATAIFGLALAAHGSMVYSFSGDPTQVIPDNNPSGVAYEFDFSYTGRAITDVSVTFTITGGWNGDLYAHLSHGSDTLVLLNRVGVSASSTYGYGDAGFDITLSDAGLENIHAYGGNGGSQLTGTFLADGQATSPLAEPESFSAGGGSATFANTFANTDPNGSWSLFFADVSGGSVATLEDWSVNISAVPEPVNVALGLFGLLCTSVGALRWYRRRNAK